MRDRNILDDFCIRFSSIVEKYCKYVVVSGFVAISSGRVRATEDIDMIIERLEYHSFVKLHQDLLDSGFVCIQSSDPNEIFQYLSENIPVRYVLENQILPEIEMKFAKDQLDKYQIKTRVKLPLTGLDVWFSSVNMNIAFKEKLLKSEKDFKDAEHLRKVYPERVDEREISKISEMIQRYRL